MHAFDDSVIGSNDAFHTHLASCVYLVFGVPSLCSRQIEAASKLILEKQCCDCLLVIDCTGWEELDPSHSRGVCWRRLSRAGPSVGPDRQPALLDQVRSTNSWLSEGGALEQGPGQTRPAVSRAKDECNGGGYCQEGLVCAAILRCYVQGLLRLVAIDKAHIHAMHGQSF